MYITPHVKYDERKYLLADRHNRGGLFCAFVNILEVIEKSATSKADFLVNITENTTMKRIIIIGGMGPQASLRLHELLLERAALTGAKNGNDFPEIVHFSLPIDDFISDESKTAAAFTQIKRCLERLYARSNRQNSYCL